MQPLVIAVLSAIGFVIAYNTYGRWLGRKIFKLSADAVCPSRELEDGVDYVPTSKEIVFGHHFTSIAGTGPIVGPAIAIMWGWLPALLWVLFGSVFIGAVHDFGALVVSLRNKGQTIGDVAGRLMNKRVRLLFLFILFFALTIVLAIFGLVIAVVLKQYPAAIFPCFIQIPVAIGIGIMLHKKGINLFIPSVIALGVMYLTVIFGNYGSLGELNLIMSKWPVLTWVIILLIYSYVASVLPVWTLLQPRDYINSLQLIACLALVFVGLIAAAFAGGPPHDGEKQTLQMAAPMLELNPKGAPVIFPFLFVTIACGAISGFHCLVSSGTSSKQLKKETDAKMVGYGSMLTEGFLATIVILACAAGIGLGIPGSNEGSWLTGPEAWHARYNSWQTAGSLGAKVGAFVDGSANFLGAIGIPHTIALALMGVLVASFAGTTLDSACRLQRYVVQELGRTIEFGKDNQKTRPLGFLQNMHIATILAIVLAFIIAALPIGGTPLSEWSYSSAGKGGLLLWPLFGATNQLLGGLSFLVITFYLWRRKKPLWFIAIPMVFMLIMPMWAMLINLFQGENSWINGENPNALLACIGTITILLEVWMIIEAVRLMPKAKGVLEPTASELAKESSESNSSPC